MLGAIILANSSFLTSCDFFTEIAEEKELQDFLESEGIEEIMDLSDIPTNYYEAEVSVHEKLSDDKIMITNHYEKLDRIDNVICQAREFDYDYKVLKIEKVNDSFEINEKIVDNIDERPFGYEYVYPDDYVISNGYCDVLINYGKVLKRE